MKKRDGRDLLCDWLKPSFDDYPNALADVYCFASCGEGWKELVLSAVRVAESEGVRIAQIKEKFGALCIHTDGCAQHTRAAIEAAERASHETCEGCGAPGTATTDGRWMLTLCAACKSARGRS